MKGDKPYYPSNEIDWAETQERNGEVVYKSQSQGVTFFEEAVLRIYCATYSDKSDRYGNASHRRSIAISEAYDLLNEINECNEAEKKKQLDAIADAIKSAK
jgi:hypothetical protein